MADKQPSLGYLCGRLYATLHALQVIGERDAGLASPKFLARARQHPGPRVREQLAKTGRHLLAAKARGPKHWKAATEVFHAIVRFIPPDGTLPNHLYGPLQDDFTSGFDTEVDAYTAAYGALMR